MTEVKTTIKSLDYFDALKMIHDFDIDVVDFSIYLLSREEYHDSDTYYEPGVEYMQANRFIKNLNILNSINDKKPILVHMKTTGGYVYEGQAMYDTMIAISNPITILNYTQASSMSSVIFQGGNKRIMMPNSHFMFHQGELSAGGTAKQVQSTIEFDKKWNDSMLDIYVDRIKSTPGSKLNSWSKGRIKNWLIAEMDKKEDVYLTAQEAVEYGFADEVFSTYETFFDYTDQQLKVK